VISVSRCFPTYMDRTGSDQDW